MIMAFYLMKSETLLNLMARKFCLKSNFWMVRFLRFIITELRLLTYLRLWEYLMSKKESLNSLGRQKEVRPFWKINLGILLTNAAI